MKNKWTAMSMGILALVLAGGLIAEGQEMKLKPEEWQFRLRVMEGLKEGAPEPANVVTSSYLKYTLTANIPSEEDLTDEERQIQKIFNLNNVKLLTEANLGWKAGGSDKASHIFRLDGRTYQVFVSGGNLTMRLAHNIVQRFGIEVIEEGGNKKTSLLDTEFTIPNWKHVAVFGFEDTQGKPYFISLRPTKMFADGGERLSDVIIGVAQSEGLEKKREEFRKDAVACKGDIEPPKLIKKVDPVYPEEARKNGVQGVVILEAKIDERGRVIDAMVLRSIPRLDQAAIAALKQWVYEPLIIDGKPRKALFTVTVNFRLSEEDIEKFAEGAVKVTDAIPPPKLIRKIEPVYPAVARKAAVEGVVILEARTDVDGRVKNVRVLRSVPILDQAAIDAVKQWVYEPLIINGQPKEAIFTTTVRFVLNGKKEKGGAGGTATGDVLIPKLIKKLDPVYPEAARQAGIQGLVLLEATTDEKGNVAAVRVLKSIPELDQAAIDALKQWKYEPLIVEGKPKGVAFTVTIQFRLQ